MAMEGSRRRAVAFVVAAIAVAGCPAGGRSVGGGPPAAAAPVTTAVGTPGLTAGPGHRHPPRTYGRWGAPVLADTFSGPRPDPRRWQIYQAPNARTHPGVAAGTHVAHGRLMLDGG